MYCQKDLGSNEVVEDFPVGRRLAFDAEKGRLWVVCRRCERWNLTPLEELEERWEAVETCERLFRGTRVRVSTENIGLAKHPEGLQLVRIGRPLRRGGRRFVGAWRISSAGGGGGASCWERRSASPCDSAAWRLGFAGGALVGTCLKVEYAGAGDAGGSVGANRSDGTRPRPGLWRLLARAVRWCVTAVLLAVLPFILLVRGGVFAYHQWGLGAWPSLAVSAGATALLLALYAWAASRRLGAGKCFRRLTGSNSGRKFRLLRRFSFRPQDGRLRWHERISHS